MKACGERGRTTLQLLRIGDAEPELLEDLRGALEVQFRIPCEILPAVFRAEASFHRERGQYHSTQILVQMAPWIRQTTWRLLGVTAADLYIPILTFVFGEAQVGDSCAVVSYHRLRQEFYGLPSDAVLLRERLLKEAIHELGHTFELTHCDDYRCVMAASHAVEWIDLKTNAFCPACRRRLPGSLDTPK